MSSSSKEEKSNNNDAVLIKEVQVSAVHTKSQDGNEIYVEEMTKLLSDESEATMIATNNLKNVANTI